MKRAEVQPSQVAPHHLVSAVLDAWGFDYKSGDVTAYWIGHAEEAVLAVITSVDQTSYWQDHEGEWHEGSPPGHSDTNPDSPTRRLGAK